MVGTTKKAQQAPKPKKGKKVAPTPAVLLAVSGKGKDKKDKKAKKPEKQQNPLFIPRPRDAGKAKRPWAKRDLTRFTKWPKYIIMQRQKSLLLQRLKVPPALHQFHRSNAMDTHQAREVLGLLHKYRPETKSGRRIRMKKEAEDQAAGKDTVQAKRPKLLCQGINRVVTSVCQKKAKLVVMAHDVDPIEIIAYLPALCRKMGVPYCILKSKARLGALVRMKTCTAVCLNDVDAADKGNLSKVIEMLNENFINRFDDIRKTWGGGHLSAKAVALKTKIENAKIAEQKKAEKAAAK